MNQRSKGFFWIAVTYIVAFAAGILLYFQLEMRWGVVLALFALDFAATAIVWLVGLVFKNASFYDPYWSLAPHVMALFVAVRFGQWSATNILFLAVLSLWSLRLTANWAETFHSVKTQDWRYDMYRNKFPRLWPVINLFGIHLMPTLLVFGGMLPGFALLRSNAPFAPAALLGAAVVVFGFWLQLVADGAMHRHLAGEYAKQVCQTGVWKYSRHPNYLGEVCVWFGVYFMCLAVEPAAWRLGVGALAILALFLFVSIPMMEKRLLARRPEYAEYQKTTSKLLLWRPKPAEQPAEVSA